jgi:hypothetical protein
MNWVQRIDLPVPLAPATRMLSPSDSAARHRVQLRMPVESRPGALLAPQGRQAQHARERLKARVGDAEDVHTGQRVLPAALHHLHLAHHAVAVQALVQGDDAISHGEHESPLGSASGFAQQEGGGLPAGEAWPNAARGSHLAFTRGEIELAREATEGSTTTTRG